MRSIVIPLLIGLRSSFRRRSELQVEIAALHQQLAVLQQRLSTRPRLRPLAAVFDTAERTHAALFFDEADALFGKPGIHLTQVTPTSCSWTHSVLASQSATIERYGVGSTAMACCTRR